jgi:hypothetical protein
MEKNTVRISIEYYNELRDFKKGIEDGEFVTYNPYSGKVYSITESDVLILLKSRIKKLEEERSEVQEKIFKLENPKKISFWNKWL